MFERMITASSPILSLSSACHCSQRWGRHMIAKRLISLLSRSSLMIIRASIVFPIPTSSAMSSLTVCCLSAMMRGTIW